MRTAAVGLGAFVLLLAMHTPPAVASEPTQYGLYHGWDRSSEPLTSGQVVVTTSPITGELDISYVLKGAEANHTYIVGAHFFNDGTSDDATGYFGAGWYLDGWVMLSRQGHSAWILARDFGTLTTDAAGDGTAAFILFPHTGTYHLEFTVRIGPVCVLGGDVSGCDAVFQTGSAYSIGLQTLKVSKVPTTHISMGPQAMEGALTVRPGDTLKAGFDLRILGKHQVADVTFSRAKMTFKGRCIGTGAAVTLTVPVGDRTYRDRLNSVVWYPSGDQTSALTFQGSLTVPNGCSEISLARGGTFTAGLNSTKSNTVSVRWHYSALGSAGRWSGSASFTPAPGP